MTWLLLATFLIVFAACFGLMNRSDRPVSMGAIVTRALLIWAPIWLAAFCWLGMSAVWNSGRDWPAIGVVLVTGGGVAAIGVLVLIAGSAARGIL